MSSNPQEQVIEALIKKFRPGLAPFVGMKPEMDRAEVAHKGEKYLTLGEIAECLAEAGLLVSGETRWAVLNEDDDEIYDNREDAARALSFLREAEMGYRLYEIREVDRG